mmetsp:Transcript_32486/g.75876  ORF Transcript_32486/g.75876 Transcript_32486/m.75876 type:complete len:228 (+) Transcript_32486:720-1403(+)
MDERGGVRVLRRGHCSLPPLLHRVELSTNLADDTSSLRRAEPAGFYMGESLEFGDRITGHGVRARRRGVIARLCTALGHADVHNCGAAVSRGDRGDAVCAHNGPFQFWRQDGFLPRNWPAQRTRRGGRARVCQPKATRCYPLAHAGAAADPHPVPGAAWKPERPRGADGRRRRGGGRTGRRGEAARHFGAGGPRGTSRAGDCRCRPPWQVRPRLRSRIPRAGTRAIH